MRAKLQTTRKGARNDLIMYRQCSRSCREKTRIWKENPLLQILIVCGASQAWQCPISELQGRIDAIKEQKTGEIEALRLRYDTIFSQTLACLNR